MTPALTAAAVVLAALWVPLAIKFNRAWQARRNPVSLAICATAMLFIYTNALFILTITGSTTWQFYATATRVLELGVAVNFYIAFRWSDMKFNGARRDEVPPLSSV